MWGMLFRIVVALALAYFVSGLVAELLSVPSDALTQPGILARVAERGWALAELSWPFALFAVAIAELVGIRSLLYYLAAGALVAIGAASFDQGAWDFDLVASWLPRWRDSVLALGVAGGLTYWLAHGYKTGLAGASFRQALANDPWSMLAGSARSQRGFMAGIAGLVAAAGVAVWTLDESRFNEKPARDAERSVGAALASGGYPWAKLRIDGDIGQIVGVAPDAKTRDAAFETAKQLAQPLIGAAGVMTALESKLTIPDPAAVAAAQAATRRLAEEEAKRVATEAAKRKAEEDTKRAGEVEVKRKADEQVRRAAAEAEIKRKAEEARRAALAAEAEAKRLADAEAKRLAAELEAKRVAMEAEAKRKAEEDARKLALEAEAARRRAEDEAKRVAAEAEVKRKAAEEDTKRIAAETEAKRKADAEAKRVAAETEAIKKKAEADAKRMAAEAESAKRKADLESKMAEAKARRATDDAARKLAAAMADKKNDIPGKIIAAVPAGPAPAKPSVVPAVPAQPSAATAPPAAVAALCAAEPLGVIRDTRIALRRSDRELPPETSAQLDRLAAALKSCGDAVVRVSGYSTRGFDRRAKADHSRLLATRVAEELARRGITKDRLRPSGLGAPVAVAGLPDLPGRRVELALVAASSRAAPASPALSTQTCTSDPAALRLAFGSAREMPGGGYRAQIDRIARILLACGNARFVVEGHTDATGSDDLNMRLSQRRADLVKRALMRRAVPEARLTATGLGSSKPLDLSGTRAAKAANRRVDIVVVAGAPATPAAPPAKAPPAAKK